MAMYEVVRGGCPCLGASSLAHTPGIPLVGGQAPGPLACCLSAELVLLLWEVWGCCSSFGRKCAVPP